MAYIGSCPDMCPEKERQTRFGLYMSIFERDSDNQPDEYAMVKEYRRSGADQEEPLPKDLRTPRALEITMDYLVCNIMDDARSKSQELATDWYDFLWDRLRAIRKDLTQQNICDPSSVILVERCARFHVHSCYAMNQVKDFDVDMNKRNLNDCLQMLRQMYIDLKITSNYPCPGELEFQKYDILLHLAEDHLSSNVLMKTSPHRSTNEMKFVTKIFNAYTNNDYFKFFQLMEQADYMTSCVLSLYANKMRATALKSITSSCPPRQVTLYPFTLFKHALGFDDNDDISIFASNFNIPVQVKDYEYFLAISRDLIGELRRLETSLPAFKSKRMVESKMNGKLVGQLVYGAELPENPYRRFPQEKNVSVEFDQGQEEEEEDEEEEEVIFEEDETTNQQVDFDENEESNQEIEFEDDDDDDYDVDDDDDDDNEVEVEGEETHQEVEFEEEEDLSQEVDFDEGNDEDEHTNQEVEFDQNEDSTQAVKFHGEDETYQHESHEDKEEPKPEVECYKFDEPKQDYESQANEVTDKQEVESKQGQEEAMEETNQEADYEEADYAYPFLKKTMPAEKVAKIMPAGKFKTYTSASKLPFLQQSSMQSNCPPTTPTSKPKFRKLLDSINARVESEEQVIHTFRELIEFYKSYK